MEKLKFMNFSLKLGKINGLVEPLNYMELGGILERKKNLAKVIEQVNWEINSKMVEFPKPNLFVDLGLEGRDGGNLDPT